MAMQGTLPKVGIHHRVTLLRMSYWIYAVFELMALVPMLSPTLFARVMGIPDFNPGIEYGYAMGTAAAFTSGWILLLIWAARKPVERKGVMLLTIAPVIVGNMVCGIYAAASGFLATTMLIPSWVAQTIIIGLFAFSYREARKIEKSNESPAK